MKKHLALAVLAGLLGGLAEIGWLALYAAFAPISAAEVGREVAVTILSSAAAAPWAPWAGAGIHMALSVILGLAFAGGLWWLSGGRPGMQLVWASAVPALVAVWAINFFLVLPALGSDLSALMPLGATLLSKVLFGVAMAAVLQKAAA
jgi:hypothetical protein